MVTRHGTRRRERRRRTPVARILGWALLGAVGLVLVAGVWTAIDALRVREQLEEAAAVVPQLKEQVLAGDEAAIEESVTTVREAAADAVETTGRPHWRLTALLPGVGPNVQAVRTLSSVLSDLAEEALLGLPDVAAAVSPASLAPKDGRVDLDAIAAQAPVVVAADDSVDRAIAEIDRIDTGSVLPLVGDAVIRLRDELVDLRIDTATAAKAVTLIPPMMGIDGPREYLVLVQNNAEPRALGGIAGSVLRLRVEGGSFELVEQVAGNTVGFDEPVGELTEAETALFGTQLGRYLLNVTSTPDFPRAAEITSAMWEEERGQKVDGVLSIDPVALAKLLEATGPVTTADGVILTADNAAQYLLNQIYLDVPEPADQDRFFAGAAQSIFDAISGGVGDAGKAVTSLAEGAAQGRVMLWAADPQEQAELSGTILSGELPTDPSEPVLGVYLNDGTGAKAGFYLNVATSVKVVDCRPDGSQRLEVSTTLNSTLPDPATLPPYVTGGGVFVENGEIRTNILLYMPAGGTLVSLGSGGVERPLLSQVDQGVSAYLTTVSLRPTETVTLEYEVLTSKGSVGPPGLRVTPGQRESSQSIDLGCAAA